MPYPYYNPVNYNPSFFPASYSPMVQAQNAAASAASAPSQPVNNNGLIWVQGETGAKSYIVAPNSTVLLMDSEAQRFYIKSSDAAGMPLPLKVYEYRETQNAAVSEPKAIDYDKFVTREELDKRLAEFAAKKTTTKKEVKEDE